nr:hypothetical protein CFP56_37765 [Quercus suber]
MLHLPLSGCGCQARRVGHPGWPWSTITGEMARDHDYYQWYRPVTRTYIDRNSARLHQMIESHLALLNWLLVGSQEHNHVRRILYNVAGFGGDPTATGQASNRTETESATTAAPSTSVAPVTTPTRGQHDTASPSTSAARGRGRLATASPSTSTARGCGQPVTASLSPTAARGSGRPATASPSTSAARGRGRCATTPRVVSSPEIPAPIPHASPQPEPSPFTPRMHPETPLSPPTSSSALTLPMDPPSIEPMTMIPTPGLYIEHHDPPTSSLSDPLGPPVGIDPLQPDIDVPDEHPPHQPSPPRGRPQCARRAPTCGTGGHKIGHKGSSMHDDEPKADAPQPPPPPKHCTRIAAVNHGSVANPAQSKSKRTHKWARPRNSDDGYSRF